jgi:hypothetical protein
MINDGLGALPYALEGEVGLRNLWEDSQANLLQRSLGILKIFFFLE